MIASYYKKMTKDQSRDTGMAMVLLMLIGLVVLNRREILLVAIGLHVLNMTWPLAYKPVAFVWLGLSERMGAVVSKLILAIVFFAVVTPIGIMRRIMGKDSLHLKTFKASEESAMSRRNHIFTGVDIEKPY